MRIEIHLGTNLLLLELTFSCCGCLELQVGLATCKPFVWTWYELQFHLISNSNYNFAIFSIYLCVHSISGCLRTFLETEHVHCLLLAFTFPSFTKLNINICSAQIDISPNFQIILVQSSKASKSDTIFSTIPNASISFNYSITILFYVTIFYFFKKHIPLNFFYFL